MKSQSLKHDVAWAATVAILELFNLRPEEYREAHPMVYEAVKAALESYDLHREQMLKRLRPLSN
jgi:hypothetical protein